MMRTDEEFEALKARWRDEVARGRAEVFTLAASRYRPPLRRLVRAVVLAAARAGLLGVLFGATLGPWWAWLGAVVVALEEVR